MRIRNSILAGELLLMLENVSGSVRIVDIEIFMQITKREADLAVVRLISEGLIELIKEEDRGAVVLTKNSEKRRNQYLNNSTAGTSYSGQNSLERKWAAC